jgi:MarC family membrane protein
MHSELFSATVLLLFVLDPFGNVPLVVSALATTRAERRPAVVLRECIIAYVLLLAFLFGGQAFLDLMHLSASSLSIAGGLILFLIALRMIFARPAEGVFGDAGEGEPFIVPLAVPAIAGPSAMATVMLMASRQPAALGTWVAALSCAMVVTTAVLLAAGRLQHWLGERVMRAFERLMGLVLTAIAVEMLLDGVRDFIAGLHG